MAGRRGVHIAAQDCLYNTGASLQLARGGEIQSAAAQKRFKKNIASLKSHHIRAKVFILHRNKIVGREHKSNREIEGVEKEETDQMLHVVSNNLHLTLRE